MSNENNPVKSDCPLIGENGNIFNLVGIAARTLKRNGLYEQASEMSERYSRVAAMRKPSASSASMSI